IISFKVDPDKIGLLIGPGGKTIKGISERFDVNTNIDDDGTVTIYTKESGSGAQAKDAFMSLLEEPEIGKTYEGVVRRIVDFGAFIEFLPGKEGLCHISRMADHRVESVEDVLSMNQTVPVKIIEIDKMGRVNLSLIYEGADDSPHRPRDRDRDRGGRDSRGRGGRDGGRDRDRR
ncbi:MAG: S1 RNA-binding domain-containing protein, partial [Spirochaetota bacterium]